jgi:hypothetical protein
MQRRPSRPQKGTKAYRDLWRVIDGAVMDAFNKHPNYVAAGESERTVRNSIVKRAVGAVLSFADERGVR